MLRSCLFGGGHREGAGAAGDTREIFLAASQRGGDRCGWTSWERPCRGREDGDCTLEDVLLPAQLYPFCVPGARAAPYEYLYDLEVWSDKGSEAAVDRIGDLRQRPVILEEITQGGAGRDQRPVCDHCHAPMAQAETPVLAVSGSGAQTDRDTRTGAASARTYTVESGDCLWSIAQKFYGSGAQYKRLAAANPAITNPNLIYPARC